MITERTAELVRRWREAGGDDAALPPDVAARLPEVFAASGYVADCATRDTKLVAVLAATGELDRPRRGGEVAAFAATLVAGIQDESTFMDALRRLRQRELVRIAWRDLTGAAPLEETLMELSALADTAIAAALGFASRALAVRYGVPRSARGERRREPRDFTLAPRPPELSAAREAFDEGHVTHRAACDEPARTEDGRQAGGDVRRQPRLVCPGFVPAADELGRAIGERVQRPSFRTGCDATPRTAVARMRRPRASVRPWRPAVLPRRPPQTLPAGPRALSSPWTRHAACAHGP